MKKVLILAALVAFWGAPAHGLSVQVNRDEGGKVNLNLEMTEAEYKANKGELENRGGEKVIEIPATHMFNLNIPMTDEKYQQLIKDVSTGDQAKWSDWCIVCTANIGMPDETKFTIKARNAFAASIRSGPRCQDKTTDASNLVKVGSCNGAKEK